MSNKKSKKPITTIDDLTPEEIELLDGHRHLKEHARTHGFDPKQVPFFWSKGKYISAFVRPDNVFDVDDIIEDMCSIIAKTSKKRATRQRKLGKKYVVIDAADLHIGKLAVALETGDKYDMATAVERVRTGVEEIIRKVTKLYSERQIRKIIFVMGNDILHVDNQKRQTTNGTPQDTDGMWYEAMTAAAEAYCWALNQLTAVAPVHALHCMSNHDKKLGYAVAKWVEASFANDKNIVFDCSPADRKYFEAGVTMLGFTHGDKCKVKDLPCRMREETRQQYENNWKYGKWFVHHLHHKIVTEYIGAKNLVSEEECGSVSYTGIGRSTRPPMEAEHVRSASGTDSWHSGHGYTGQIKAVEAFVFDHDMGEEARFVISF